MGYRTLMSNPVHTASVRGPRRRRRRLTLLESWIALSDDPPGLCCTGDDLCPACAA